MFEFKDISKLTVDELFKELGIADFTLIETTDFIDQLNAYRERVYNLIKEKNNNGQSLDKTIGHN